MRKNRQSGEMLDIRVAEGEAPEQVARRHGLDMRFKYSHYAGRLCTTEWVTVPCSGCNGGGCSECGYQGKVNNPYPQVIWSNMVKQKAAKK